MTQDEVIKEMHNVIADNQNYTTWTVSTPHLVELVNRAIKAEREACAKIVDDWSAWHGGTELIAAVIRERGQA
jgi:hypothetical protein